NWKNGYSLERAHGKPIFVRDETPYIEEKIDVKFYLSCWHQWLRTGHARRDNVRPKIGPPCSLQASAPFAYCLLSWTDSSLAEVGGKLIVLQKRKLSLPPRN